MGVTTALSNGISGLLTLGDALNVIGDNLANVNTTGFKSSSALFETVFAQTLSGGTAPSGQLFGINPIQLGLGVSTSTISRNFGQGSLASTGNSNDLAILGEGFFVLSDVTGALSFTRDGSFSTADDGTIIDPSTGLAVLGFPAVDGVVTPTTTPSPIVIPSGISTAKATENALFSGNFDASGAIAVDGNINTGPAQTTGGGASVGGDLLTALDGLGLSVGDVIELTARKGAADVGPVSFTVTAAPTPGDPFSGDTYADLATFLESALGINTDPLLDPAAGVTIGAGGELTITSNIGDDNLISNVRMTTNGVAAGFDGVYDPVVGEPFTVTDATEPGESFVVSGLSVFDSLGNSVPLSLTFVRTGPSELTYFVESPFGTAITGGTITYDMNGQFVSAASSGGGDPLVSIPRTGTGAVDPLAFQLDFSTTSFLAGVSDLALGTQDGFPIGDLDSFFVGVDGTITGRFTNGLTRVLGQLALATFNNPQGLLSVGENRFVLSPNSGDAQIGTPASGGRGTLASGFLEGSNTDLAREFSNIILTQRGFQANARTITTADTLLQELIGLVR